MTYCLDKLFEKFVSYFRTLNAFFTWAHLGEHLPEKLRIPKLKIRLAENPQVPFESEQELPSLPETFPFFSQIIERSASNDTRCNLALYPFAPVRLVGYRLLSQPWFN